MPVDARAHTWHITALLLTTKNLVAGNREKGRGVHDKRKTLRKLYGDAKASTLVGKAIQLYIDHKVRDPQDGSITDGIRIRPFKPRVQEQAAPPIPVCTDCGQEITPAMGKDARWVAGYTAHNYGVALCAACAQKRKEAAQKASEAEPPAAPGEEEEEPL